MGCDGGTIPKRHELVRTAKKPEQKDKDMDRRAKWSTCSISQQALRKPIVTCELGKLYSKESVLEFLLDRSICQTASHIRNLKDIKQLHLTENPDFNKDISQLADQYVDNQVANYVCPIVGIEMNGKYKFCAIWSCGCVLSERALKEVDSKTCHKCGSKFASEDLIILNPDDGDLVKMIKNMKVRREKLKAMKKEKKNKRKSDSDISSVPKSNGEFAVPKPILNGSNLEKQSTSDNKNEAAKLTLASTAKKTKMDVSKNDVKSVYIDPKQSKVYKNLFTSSESNKRDKNNSAHWITYNPYHL